MHAGGQDHNHEWFGGRLCTSLNAYWRTSWSWTACRIWNLNGDCLERHTKKGIVALHWGSVTLAPSIAMLLFDVQVVHAEEQGHNHLWLRGRLCTSLTSCLSMYKLLWTQLSWQGARYIAVTYNPWSSQVIVNKCSGQLNRPHDPHSSGAPNENIVQNTT